MTSRRPGSGRPFRKGPMAPVRERCGRPTLVVAALALLAAPLALVVSATGPAAASAPPGPNSVMAFGAAAGVPGAGSVTALPGPTVGMAATPDGNGYWVVTAGGQVTAEGDATNYGSLSGVTLNAPILGMAATSDGGGYWLVGGGRRHLLLRRRPVLRLDRRHGPQPAGGGHGRRSRRRRLLAGGGGRWHLLLRRRPVLRLHRQPWSSTSRWWAWRRCPAGAATGWWPPTAASSPSATPSSTAPPAALVAQPAGGGHGARARRGRLLAGGLRRRPLLLRRRPVLRLGHRGLAHRAGPGHRGPSGRVLDRLRADGQLGDAARPGGAAGRAGLPARQLVTAARLPVALGRHPAPAGRHVVGRAVQLDPAGGHLGLRGGGGPAHGRPDLRTRDRGAADGGQRPVGQRQPQRLHLLLGARARRHHRRPRH